MSLKADEIRDMRINSDRQIQIGSEGDWELTDGIETVKQSVAIRASNIVRPLVGNPADGALLADIEEQLRRELNRDEQISNVRQVSVQEVNNRTNTIKVRATLDNNNDYEIPIQL